MRNRVHNSIPLLNGKRFEGFLKYILRIFIAFTAGALVFGFFAGIFLSIKYASLEGFGTGLSAGFTWALLVFAVLLPLDVFEKIKCYRKYGFIDFRVRQERTLWIHAEYDSIFDTLQNEFRTWKKIQLKKKDIKLGIIEIETGRSWRSFGEKVGVTLLKSQDGKVHVTVSSKPKIFTTVIDFSKNFTNVQRIILGMKKGRRLDTPGALVPKLVDR